MSEASEILENISNRNRNSFRENQIKQQQQIDKQQEAIVVIVGYDAQVGLWKVKDNRGSVYYARAISNSGNLCEGNSVSVSIASGRIPVIDATPV